MYKCPAANISLNHYAASDTHRLDNVAWALQSAAMDTHSVYRRWIHALLLVGLVGMLSFGALTTLAHETDNFFLPLDTELADLGEFLEAVHTSALEAAVVKANAGIERALKIKDLDTRSKRMARWHDRETLARAVAAQFGTTAAETRTVRNALSGSWARRAYPGQATTHSGIWMNFSAHLPLDLRNVMMVEQAPTIKAYGVYFGTDKFTHFHHLGWSYYKMYRSLLADGSSKEEALSRALRHHIKGGWFAEAHFYGTLSTGVYSNGDMAANYLGFKFFLNLTEPVVLQGVERGPLLVRCGVFWRLNDQVRLRSGWFKPFISDHWNEALNPSLYDALMRPGIRRVLRSRADPIVQFYTQKDRRPKDPAYYDNLAHELSTYCGESYGHSGEFEKLMTIGNTCMPTLQGHGTGASQ